MTDELRSAMLLVLAPKKIFDVERPALTRIERANAVVDIGQELPELCHVRQQPLADLLPISLRKIGHLRDCFFERFHHGCMITRATRPKQRLVSSRSPLDFGHS